MRFRDLGDLRVQRDGVEKAVPRKLSVVLALLLTRLNQRVSVDAIVDAVWGEQAGPGAFGTLETHIYRLRRILEPEREQGQAPTVVVNDAGGYRLLARVGRVDSARFLQLTGEVRELLDGGSADRALRRVDEALSLWRGRPYGELADQEWAAPTVARLEEARQQMHEHRVDALLATGRGQQALLELEVLLPAAPLREGLWARRMLALYRCSRLDEALAAYQQARTVLRDELGVDPSPDLQRLQQRMLDHDDSLALPRRPSTAPSAQVSADNAATSTARSAAPAVAAAAAVVGLPRRTSPLIGRADELTAVLRQVRDRPLVTITGAAGCGKTRLASEVARRSGDQFPDGIWFVDLAAIDDPTLVAELIASTLGLSPPAVGSVLDALSSFARNRRMLLVLDNCEHLVDAVHPLAEELLGDDAAVHILSTSREAIGIDLEVIWSLSPLQTPTATTDGPALELFLSRMTATAPTIQLTAEDLVEAREICVGLDGLPLALELAASRIRSATLTEISQQVRSAPGSLTRLPVGRLSTARTLRDHIEWSHRLLSGPEQILHRRLTVLPGTFTAATAQSVAGTPPLRSKAVPALLDSLVNRSLLVATRSERTDGVTLYRQLVAVRDHGAHALRSAGDHDQAIAGREAWIGAFLERRRRLGAADTTGWFDELDDNFAVVRAVLQHRLVEDPGPLACRVLARIIDFWYYRGRMAEADRWLELAVASPEADPTDLKLVRLSLATSYGMRGRYDVSRPMIIETLAELGTVPEARRADVIEELAAIALSAFLYRQNDLVDALRHAAVRTCRDDPTGEFDVVADALNCLVDTYATPLRLLTRRAAEIYHRAMAQGSLIAAWHACIVQIELSQLTHDPANGLQAIDRCNTIQVQLGARPEVLPLEYRAIFMADLDGSESAAVQLYSAAKGTARRTGLVWPLLPSTPGNLERLRSRLGVDAYDNAWAAGATMPPDTALRLRADGTAAP